MKFATGCGVEALPWVRLRYSCSSTGTQLWEQALLTTPSPESPAHMQLPLRSAAIPNCLPFSPDCQHALSCQILVGCIDYECHSFRDPGKKGVYKSFDSPLKLGWNGSSMLLSTHTVSILGYGNNIFVSALPLERLMLFTVLSMGLYCIRVLTFISEIYVVY